MTLEEYMDVPFNVREVMLGVNTFFAINIVIGACPKSTQISRVYMSREQYVRMDRFAFKAPKDWLDYQDIINQGILTDETITI